jgi:hypothetical protein
MPQECHKKRGDHVLNAYYPFFLFSCLLFIIVVVIEANVMRKFFKTETFGELIRINLASNSLSTLLAVPTAFFISLILLLSTIEFVGNFVYVLIAPAIILLFFIAYFISVWIERWVITKFLGKKYNQEAISHAVRSANKASYIVIFIACTLNFYVYKFIPNIPIPI